MNVILFGATGMIGHGALLECLDDPEVTAVTTVGRREVPLEHEKLTQLVHADFTDFAPVADRLSGFDACLWCLGVSAAGMSEADYRRITIDYTLAAAKVLAEQSPGLTFCFISGAGTSRDGRAMWARVKAEAEDRLGEFPFARRFNFRPALIQPKRGARSTITSYRVAYAVLAPVFPLLHKLPKYVTTTEELGRAMLYAAKHGAPSETLENADIRQLAEQARADGHG